MLSRSAAAVALAIWLVRPVSAEAQFRLSDITVRDVATVVDVAVVVARGEQYLGVPYKWGGSTPAGFDCSGFVQYIYRDQGVSLPRTSRQMAHAGVDVPADVSWLREGDLMLFASNGSRIDHVAIYAGGNQIIHSSSSGNGVRYDDLGSSRGRWYVSHMVAARRVTDNGRSLENALVTGRIPFDFFDPPDEAPRIR